MSHFKHAIKIIIRSVFFFSLAGLENFKFKHAIKQTVKNVKDCK